MFLCPVNSPATRAIASYLSKLLAASDRIVADKESDDDLRLLLAPGSSLSGARPKAAVTDADGNLHIAKFPQAQDEYSVKRWSYLAHRLAAKAGINVPPCQIIARRPPGSEVPVGRLNGWPARLSMKPGTPPALMPNKLA